MATSTWGRMTRQNARAHAIRLLALALIIVGTIDRRDAVGATAPDWNSFDESPRPRSNDAAPQEFPFLRAEEQPAVLSTLEIRTRPFSAHEAIL